MNFNSVKEVERLIYSISYDFNKPGQDYQEFYNAIQSLGKCIHPLESTWLVSVPSPQTLLTSTSYSRAPYFCDELKKYLDPDDHILVQRIFTEDSCGYFGDIPGTEDVLEWIRLHSRD